MPDTAIYTKCLCFIHFSLRNRGVNPSNCDYAVSQYFMCDCQQKRRINPAGKSNRQTAQFLHFPRV